MSQQDALIAVHRFGFGPNGDDLKRISADPRGWLLAQLQEPATPSAAFADLPPSSDNVLDWWDAVVISVSELVRRIRNEYRDLWAQEAKARLAAAITTEQPFYERLVWFWGNHFTCSGMKAVAVGMAGGHEREAVRPRVTGRFYDLAVAAISHPGMLFYLDNYSSVGSQSSVAGYNRRGLNENLAREVMELHTLGVNGGYSQDDVKAFAQILTGWTFARRYEPNPGGFHFRNDYHEPGSKTVRGVQYEEAGEDEGRAVIHALARDPATARHIAERFARHFVADTPPDTLVDKLADTFLETDGDLAALARALVTAPEAWSWPLTKLKTPQEYCVAVHRALGVPPDLDMLLASLTGFGHLPFMAPSPAGWPDTEAAWLTPDGALRRARYAQAAARQALDRAGEAKTAYYAAVSATLGSDTAENRASAGDGAIEQQLALQLAAADFQRR